MSTDIGSRNKFSKRLKIAALKSNESKDRKRMSRRTRSDDEGTFGGKREARPFGSSKTGKRIYAGRETRGIADGFEKKAWSGRRHGQVDDGGVVKVKGRSVSPRTMWGLVNISEDKPSSRKTRSVAPGKEFVEADRRSKSKSDSGKGLDGGKKKQPDVSPLSSGKRKAQEKKKKRLHEDPEVLDEKPMKTKRVIRIDRNDISNKRLDDGIGDNDIKKEKKNDTEENHEMSKNAQFRAIQPSPSILSYVEDNLLGRRRLIELRRAGYNIELASPLDNIPNSSSSERERIEESVFRNKLTFFAAAKASSSFPPPELPEIAFAGRSNVGKSSLLNSLTRQWGVVRTSDKPGLTQTINFFDLGSKLCLVDLPGYGFAYAKEEVKDAWEELVKEYVSTRVGLKRVCLLIDTKWGMKPRDHELIELMERAQTKYQIVLTKTDVVFPIDVARRAMQIEETLKAHKSVVQPVMMVSSKSGAGIRSLRTVLAKIGRFAKL